MNVKKFIAEVSSCSSLEILLRAVIVTTIEASHEIAIGKINKKTIDEKGKYPIIMIYGARLPYGVIGSSHSNDEDAWKIFYFSQNVSAIGASIRYIENLIRNEHEKWMKEIKSIADIEDDSSYVSNIIEFSGYEIKKENGGLLISIIYTGN